jgi:MoaA/NifB/PqqE/SkfB family radical SAM enzyme
LDESKASSKYLDRKTVVTGVHTDKDRVFFEDLTPLLVQVELTEACNLSCRFCYNSQRPVFNETASTILQTLAEQEVMQVTLSGGEPLLHPSFFSILDQAVKSFPHVILLSNGTLMDERTLDLLHTKDILSVSISIHGLARVS